jgi:TfoX/Sxy family transcriptional regulator of competence genes
MAKKPQTKMAAGDEADPRFEPVAKAFARTRGFSLMESKSRGMRGLMLNGKSFGMSSHGRLILKMNETRASALVSTGLAKPFSPSPGKVMRGWLEVTHPKADWVALAKEALDLAAAGSAKSPAKKTPPARPTQSSRGSKGR